MGHSPLANPARPRCFHPTKDVDLAREMIAVYREAEANGIGSVSHKGSMVDAATARLFQNTVDRAELCGM